MSRYIIPARNASFSSRRRRWRGSRGGIQVLVPDVPVTTVTGIAWIDGCPITSPESMPNAVISHAPPGTLIVGSPKLSAVAMPAGATTICKSSPPKDSILAIPAQPMPAATVGAPTDSALEIPDTAILAETAGAPILSCETMPAASIRADTAGVPTASVLAMPAAATTADTAGLPNASALAICPAPVISPPPAAGLSSGRFGTAGSCTVRPICQKSVSGELGNLPLRQRKRRWSLMLRVRRSWREVDLCRWSRSSPVC